MKSVYLPYGEQSLEALIPENRLAGILLSELSEKWYLLI